MAEFYIKNWLPNGNFILKTKINAREVLERIYLRIGTPRPYALARKLALTGPKSFEGVVRRSPNNPLTRRSHSETRIHGQVFPTSNGTRVEFEVQDEGFTPAIARNTMIIVFLIGTLMGTLQAMDGRFPYVAAIIWAIGLGLHLIRLFGFRQQVKSVRSYMNSLLEGIPSCDPNAE